MDAFLDDTNADAFPALSYDDTTAYEEQLPSATEQAAAASLARRIGSKVYLLADTTARLGKRKLGEEEPSNSEDVDMDGDTTSRSNALLLHGTPISSLPTASLFAYATHFEAQPLGLEWVDDERCVFVFDSKTDARTGYKCLQKHISEEPDAEGFITAKPIPVAIWPPEERINNSLGKGQGLKGTIRMRWAKSDDVKKRGAKNVSQFYKKHGWTAGKESYDEPAAPSPPKRRRRGSVEREDDDRVRAALDAELDAFINGDDDAAPVPAEPQPDLDLDVSDLPASPPSKMRSDYIGSDGRSLLQRTSVMRVRPDTLESRLTAPLPQRSRPRGTMYADSMDDTRREEGQSLQWGRESRRNGGGGSRRDNGRRNGRGERGDRSEHVRTRNGRPVKTAQDLDAELDAFLLEDKN